MPKNTFCSWLQEFVTNNPVNIILGDFDINGFHENHMGIILIVNTFTHISGSLLDDVYIHREFARDSNIDVICIYFSDYDTTKFKLIESLLIQLPKTTAT